MNRFFKLAAATAAWILFLTGCWDLKDIQDISYVSSIGIDYVDQEYVVYVQMLDLSTVAKAEGGKSQQEVAIWIGTGRGETMPAAFTDLYRSSHLRIYFGQMDSLVVHENILKSGKVFAVHDMINRYYEMRYTPWVFGTKENLEELFNVQPLFNLSQAMTLLHQPNEIYRQYSLIHPITVRELITDMFEPARTVMLPSLSLDEHSWIKGDQHHGTYTIDGIFLFSKQEYLGWLSAEEIPGIPWVIPETSRNLLQVNSGDVFQASMFLESPKIEIKHRHENGKPVFDYKVKLKGYANENPAQLSERELEQRAAEEVEKQIREVYEQGMNMNADLLGLYDFLYRRHLQEFKKLQETGKLTLMKDTLGHIEAKVQITNSGKFILRYEEPER